MLSCAQSDLQQHFRYSEMFKTRECGIPCKGLRLQTATRLQCMPSARCAARVCPPVHHPALPCACSRASIPSPSRAACPLHLTQVKIPGNLPPCHHGPNDGMASPQRPPLHPSTAPIAPIQPRPSPGCREFPVPEERRASSEGEFVP